MARTTLLTSSTPLQLSSLAQSLGGILHGKDVGVTSLSSTSSSVTSGTLFAAIKGAKVDGHSFIPDVISQGATALLVEQLPPTCAVPAIVVPSTPRALGVAASLFAGDPSTKIPVMAVTGTNGKTTTMWLLYEALQALGYFPLRMGTLGSYAKGIIDDGDTLTTSDPLTVQENLRTATAHGCNACVMEASSHSLSQGRLEGVHFNVGIFTNLTRDHLDYHRTMEEYFQAKMHLFDLIAASPKKGSAVINLDGAGGEDAYHYCKKRKIPTLSVGHHQEAALKIDAFIQRLEGSALTFTYDGKKYVLHTAFIGEHNASNLIGVLGALISFGIPLERAISALQSARQVPGRLESVPAPGFGVYVDYAHTPDALEHALTTLRPLVQNTLWAIIGCGGDRDRGKRPLMGAIAERIADRAVVTADNPRTEDPFQIEKDILAGMKKPYLVEFDRAKAIDTVIQQAQPGDIVLIAGKGHEDYQIIGTTKIHFSDVEVAKKSLALRK